MNEMSSLFAQLRSSRANVNESVEDKVDEVLTEEEQVEEPTPDVEDEVNEEVTAIFCADCGALISGSMNESELDECPCCGSEELLEKVVKVVRDGKVVTKKVRTGKKPRLSAAQKAALAKARKKAHSSAANKKRAKSIAKGKKAGLHEEDELECTECGYVGDYEDFAVDSKGNVICPDCGAVVEVNESIGTTQTETTVDESVDTSKEDLKALLESVNAPKFVMDALDEGKEAFVTGYLNLKLKK